MWKNTGIWRRWYVALLNLVILTTFGLILIWHYMGIPSIPVINNQTFCTESETLHTSVRLELESVQFEKAGYLCGYKNMAIPPLKSKTLRQDSVVAECLAS